VARALVVGHDPALLGQGAARLPGLVVYELHHLLGEGEALLGVVGDAELDQEVGEAHDAQPDPPVSPAHLVDLGQGVVVHLDDVVEEADRRMYRLAQVVPVYVARILQVEALQVDRTQVARVIRRQMRLRARVRGLYRILRGGVVSVDLVYKDHARLAVEPRPLDDLGEQLARPHRPGNLTIPWVYQVEVPVPLHGLHKSVGDGDGDVEVVDLVVVVLAGDELLDVRVVHPQYPHVRPAPRPALLDLVRRGVIYGHERDRPRRDPHRALHEVVLGPEATEAETGPAPALVDDRLVLERVVDAVYRVFNRQDEACRELLQLPPRVHQGGRVRHELSAQHELEELLFRPLVEALGLFALFEAELALGDVRRHAAEHVYGLLDGLAALVLLQVTLLENGDGVLRKLSVRVLVSTDLHPLPSPPLIPK
jgi:hypothetical protein